MHPRGVHLGDEQAVTHGGIGSRPPALTQNVLAAGKLHDVLYGQEVVFVAKQGDQIEFFFDQRHGVLRYALGPALTGSVIGQLTQVSPRRQMRRNQVLRVFVTQFVHVELTQVCDGDGLCQHFVWIQLLQTRYRPQGAFGVAKPLVAQILYVGFQSYRGHNVLQSLTL